MNYEKTSTEILERAASLNVKMPSKTQLIEFFVEWNRITDEFIQSYGRARYDAMVLELNAASEIICLKIRKSLIC